MRQIKFRGQRLDNGEWVIGSLFNSIWVKSADHSPICNIFPEDMLDPDGDCWEDFASIADDYEVDPVTVGQYWRTINDKHLFDGDIFRFKVGDEYIVRLVRYSEEQAAFCIINLSQMKHEKWMEIEQIPDASWWKEFVKDIEVIGNIHDNPELLKAE